MLSSAAPARPRVAEGCSVCRPDTDAGKRNGTGANGRARRVVRSVAVNPPCPWDVARTRRARRSGGARPARVARSPGRVVTWGVSPARRRSGELLTRGDVCPLARDRGWRLDRTGRAPDLVIYPLEAERVPLGGPLGRPCSCRQSGAGPLCSRGSVAWFLRPIPRPTQVFAPRSAAARIATVHQFSWCSRIDNRDLHQMSDNLLDLLLDRLRATSGNHAIQSFLREVKDERSLKRGELLVSGTKEQLLQHIRDAVNHEHIAVRRLATLVAHLEENGGQHIFLFDLTPEGVEALNAESLRLAFPPMADLTPDMYSAKPAQPRIYFQHRSDALVVKQIRTSTFWKKDEERSFDRPTERAVVTVLRESRAVNLFRVCPRDQHAEIRIDRLSGYVRDKDMEEHFLTFLRDLLPVLNPTLHVTPTRIWQGFSDIIRSRDDTFMNTDFARAIR